MQKITIGLKWVNKVIDITSLGAWILDVAVAVAAAVAVGSANM